MSSPQNIKMVPSRTDSPMNSFGPSSPFRKASMKLANSPSLSSSFAKDSPLVGLRSPRLSSSSPKRPSSETLPGLANRNNSHSSIALVDDDDNLINDAELLKTVSKHLNENTTLKSQGADITRDLYKLANGDSTPKRSRSLSSSDFERHRRSSVASSINVPGGFRRDFLISKSRQGSGTTKTVTPTFLTRNFLEFLSIYGHFAGEDLEDDEDLIACNYAPIVKVDEETPLLEQERAPSKPEGTATPAKAYFLLVKAFVGTGVLFLPKAFHNGGLGFSVILLIFFGLLSFWCYLILVQSKIAAQVSSFGDIGYKLYGNWMRYLILFSIVLSQIGFCAAYIVFTSENLHAFLINVLGYDVSITFFVCAQCFIFIPLSMIRDITKLSLSALLANVFILVGLITILFYSSNELIESGPKEIIWFNKEDFSLFIGVAIFAFEGIGLIIPIQESMIEPEKFPKVLFSVIMTISAIFIGVGAIGYSAYGEHVKTVIILNLPQDSLFVNSIQFFYSLAILLSTPLQLYPAIRIMEYRIFKTRSGKSNLRTKWLKNSFRAAFVIVTALVAYFGSDNLDKFVSFVGCFACIPLVYMYPPMLHLKCVAKTTFMKIFDYFLVLIGAVAMCYTTYQILFT